MSGFAYYLFLMREAADIHAYCMPITLALLALFMGALATALPIPRQLGVPIVAAGIAPAVVPALMLLVGVAFVVPGSTAWGSGVSEPVPWMAGNSKEVALGLLQALWLWYLLLVALLTWRAWSRWPFAIASGLWWGWMAAGAYFVAGESVTGIWM